MRVTTWNINSLRARFDQLLRFSAEGGADVLCLQELKLTDEQYPEAELRDAGWAHQVWYGQPTYNGVAILSKHPLDDVQRGMRAFPEDERRVIAATVAGIRIYGLYAVNGQGVGTPKFHHKLAWYDALIAELAAHHAPSDDLIVCGDLNIAPDDLDVWDPFKCDGQLLCHPEERGRFAALQAWGLVDTYRTRQPFANEFTWWDYQKRGFTLNHGLRIDHVLATPSVDARISGVTIHRDVRGWDSPSDHAPVSVDLT